MERLCKIGIAIDFFALEMPNQSENYEKQLPNSS